MRILILSNLISYTYNFRKEIIDAFVSSGHLVSVVCHIDDEEKKKELEKECKIIEVPFNGKGKNIKEEISLIKKYKEICLEVQPDIVFSFTIKMNLYGGLVSKKYKVRYVPMITGLGELEKKGRLRGVLLLIHKIVMPYAECVVFQNEDNRIFFDEHGIKYKDAVVVPGSGINFEKFKYVEYPEGEVIHLAFLGRLIKAKGIEEYMDASRRLSSPTLVFHAAGPIDDEYIERVERLVDDGKLIYEGVLSDSREYLSSCSALVLPTFHPEGLSNVILEAAALGRPVITTPRTGCKEIVENGVNGLYCKERDSDNLCAVIKKFLSLPLEKKRSMGKKGREIVERKFDRRIVVDAYMRILNS